MKKTIPFLLILFLSAFTFPPQKKITVFIIGDSTASIKEVKAFPETGWGMPFGYFFDSTVTVDNRAKNGRSTRTFIEEGRWKEVMENLAEGDYVLIQFGHNDEVPTKKSYTTEAAFRANLKMFVADTKRKKALPVLLTPVARRSFDSSDRLTDTHALYAGITRSVATELMVPLIDINEKSGKLLQELGKEKSAFLFNHLKKGEHPNYPDGIVDNTHFNELGARIMAQLVVEGINQLNLNLKDRIVQAAKK